MARRVRRKEVVRAHALAPVTRHTVNLYNGRPLLLCRPSGASTSPSSQLPLWVGALESSLEIWRIFLAMHGENLRQNTSRVPPFFLLGDPCVISASPRESRKNTIYRVFIPKGC